jgi:hypothetical protein
VQTSTDPKLVGLAPTLDEILRAVEDVKPLPELFNGASRVFLGSVAYAQIAPLMHALDRRRVAVERRDMMHPAQGVGFRPTRLDDPEWMIVPDYGTLVWAMSPAEKPNT